MLCSELPRELGVEDLITAARNEMARTQDERDDRGDGAMMERGEEGGEKGGVTGKHVSGGGGGVVWGWYACEWWGDGWGWVWGSVGVVEGVIERVDGMWMAGSCNSSATVLPFPRRMARMPATTARPTSDPSHTRTVRRQHGHPSHHNPGLTQPDGLTAVLSSAELIRHAQSRASRYSTS